MRTRGSGRVNSLYREAFELVPASHLLRSTCLDSLASALIQLFEQSGRPEGLEDAIPLYQDGLHSVPASHPDQNNRLINLAIGLLVRFK